MKTLNRLIVISVAGLLLTSTPAQCRDSVVRKRPSLAERVELLDHWGIARDLIDRKQFDAGLPTPETNPVEAAPAEAKTPGVKLCLSQCAAGVEEVAVNRAWLSSSGATDLTDAALAAQTRKMGMGLNWAAMPNLRFSADYERAMDGAALGRVPPEVIRARMQWNF